MKDIQGRADVELLVNTFYERAKRDPDLGPMFASVKWEKHLPVMYLFWENALFYTGGYMGHPLQVHRALHKRSTLTPLHFQKWKDLFVDTVYLLFSGPTAELAKEKAISIATVMEIKVLES